jgi:hypothetical protein
LDSLEVKVEARETEMVLLVRASPTVVADTVFVLLVRSVSAVLTLFSTSVLLFGNNHFVLLSIAANDEKHIGSA